MPSGNVIAIRNVCPSSQSIRIGPRGVGTLPRALAKPPGQGRIAARFQPASSGSDAEHEAGQQIGGRGAPGMVPILVRLVFLVPSFPSDRRAAFDHVPPAAVGRGGDQSERFLVTAVLKEPLQQILRGVDRAMHVACLQPINDSLSLVLRHQAEGEREKVRVLRRVIGADPIAIQPRFGIEQLTLEFSVGLLNARSRTPARRRLSRGRARVPPCVSSQPDERR